jgi:hypothetical protein
MPSGASKRGQFSAAYTINMFGFDFRQAQEEPSTASEAAFATKREMSPRNHKQNSGSAK